MVISHIVLKHFVFLVVWFFVFLFFLFFLLFVFFVFFVFLLFDSKEMGKD